MKTCPKCKQLLSLDRFASHGHTRDGKQPWCRDCNSRHRKARKIALKHSVVV